MRTLFKNLNIIVNKKKFLYIPKNFKEILKLKLRKELNFFKRLKYKLSLNKYKFEEKFLYKLSNILGLYLNKKIEFNIVNMKSIIFNSDIFTKILSHKL